MEIWECIKKSGEALGQYVWILQVIAVGVTYYEYKLHKKHNCSDALSKFNERYSTNPDFKDVICFIEKVKYCKLTKTEIKDSLNSNEKLLVKVDLFFRFFEEIQLAIETGYLKDKDVCNLFYYYAKEGERLSLLSDYPKEWRVLERFLNRMSKINK